MEQYKILAECLLPEHMFDRFELKNVQVETKEETQIVHLFLDENEQKPDTREDLRLNGFTRESFHDFPIRGHEVLFHVSRRRWLDADGHNVMTECHFIQEFKLMLKTCVENGIVPMDRDGNSIRANAAFHPQKKDNEEMRAEILARSKSILMMSPDKWTGTQKGRAAISMNIQKQRRHIVYHIPSSHDFFAKMYH